MPLASIRRVASASLAVALLAAPLLAQDRAETRRALPDLHLLEPPWASPTIYRESTIPLQSEPGAPLVGRLAFQAEEMLELRSADGSRTFKEGEDFEIAPDRLTIVFPADAEVPFIKTSDLFVPKGSPASYAHRKDHPEQSLLFQNGKWFHERQLEATYRRGAATWTDDSPVVADAHLPRTLAKLRGGEAMRIVVAGDSIAAGGDASATFDVAPRMPAFPELVAAQLEESHGIDVTLTNLAVGGTSVANGVAAVPQYVAEKPDLVVVAFGMNDVGRRDPPWFRTRTEELISGIRKEVPEAEFLLVSPMIGNENWIHTPREMFPLFRDELAKLTGPGVALADVTSAWDLLLTRKHPLDMIGNGLNHPNDFGHRVYAQTILGLLTQPVAKSD